MQNNLRIIKGLHYHDLSLLKKDVSGYVSKNCNIKKASKVAVKINLVGPFHPQKAATTHPGVVRLLVEALLPLGCDIVLCEDISDENVLEVTGIKEIMDEYNLKFYNLRDYGYETVVVEGMEYTYSSLIKSCDIVISVPKYKNHMLTDFTGAIKNMYGCISRKQRKELHKFIDADDFANIICSIYSIRIPDLIIMDAIVCMEGMGPSLGEPRYLGYLVLSTDGVFADYYMCNLVGYETETLQVLQSAFQSEMAKSKIDELELIGGGFQDKEESFNRVPVYKGKYRKKYMDMLKRTYKVDESLCVRCGLCVDACPFHAITLRKVPEFDRDKCALCTCCMELCPTNAINYKK
ncbi:DUF362 domain-containing protein [Ruminiclostridium papyrosolvens]|uniref:Ferredoxin n=1 Tax=Ruminiclostridium papyrosolvens C7 TaxID=1330534 RepID=U4R1B2_9FIRM|nr:DUF362 domain-containing protein [Ruminiclostridium papyrosolvens]EPR10460.1 hypothetical protein L323_12470 [Ruminiclostridium papyrosolvens C7]